MRRVGIQAMMGWKRVRETVRGVDKGTPCKSGVNFVEMAEEDGDERQ